MLKTLVLDNPIKINGEEVKELTYDANEISAKQFSEACSRAAGSLGSREGFSPVTLRENDYSLHLYLGFMSIIAVNPKIDINDLERVKGFDVSKIADIGLLFTLRTSEAASEGNNSDVQLENTADTITPVLQRSENLD